MYVLLYVSGWRTAAYTWEVVNEMGTHPPLVTLVSRTINTNKDYNVYAPVCLT